MTTLLTFLTIASRTHGGVAGALVRASIDGTITIVLLLLPLKALRRTPPWVECWLWRAAFLKLLVVIIVPASMAVALFNLGHANSLICGYGEGRGGGNAPAYIELLWLIGLTIALIRIAGSWWNASRLRKDATVCESAVVYALLSQLRQDLGIAKEPDVLVSSYADTPLLIGVRRPAILLPQPMTEIAQAELRMILTHELTHLQRRDLLWSWLSTIVGAVFFFHPLIWLARQRYTLACEAACDEAVVQPVPAQTSDYLALLLKVAGGVGGLNGYPIGAARIIGSYGSLRHRFRAMKSISYARRRCTLLSASIPCMVGSFAMLPWRIAPAEVQGERSVNVVASQALTGQSKRPRSLSHVFLPPAQTPAGIDSDHVGRRAIVTVETSTDVFGHRLVRSTQTFEP
jgi:beta-lactamase regulating signal transducer with metallopeptidase domain